MRHMKYRFHGKLLTGFLEQSTLAFEVTQGLPQGIQVIDIVYNPKTQSGVMVLKHESFEDVKSLRDVQYLPNDIVQYTGLAATGITVEEPKEKPLIIKPGEERLH